ncbi:MAG TPA: hypothetical protein DCZ94_15260 [Lentisphaeria bacterium]|nr:MAG: hypothetical protein A2X48_17350 [Lentisphaerae bacterium GWF2_49_21]HBC88309.1 hypothetical protein [Lentisphaeria bacterium]
MHGTREKFIRRLERWLLRSDFPRGQMFVILLGTGIFGFLFSFLLLKIGMTQMWMRYPAAVCLSYLVFLAFLRIWLHYQETGETHAMEDDAVDTAENMKDYISNSMPDDVTLSGDIPGFDADEIAFLIILLFALCAGMIVCMYVVWTAPNLLAELMLDAFIMNRIYKRVKRNYDSNWLLTALRRTWLPAFLLSIFLSIAGFSMQMIEPKANSIGPFIRHIAENYL